MSLSAFSDLRASADLLLMSLFSALLLYSKGITATADGNVKYITYTKLGDKDRKMITNKLNTKIKTSKVKQTI